MREHTASGTEVVDGLRGFAILWVVCYHTWLFSWFTPHVAAFGVHLPVEVLPRVGYLGVELFFLISGFCLFAPHARAAVLGTVPPPLGEFARRRGLKILPSYGLALLATVPFALAFVRSPGALGFALATHAAFVQNFFVDEFGQANSVFWSLAVEVQFYVVFPVLAVAFRRLPIPTAAAMIAVAVTFRHVTASCCLFAEVVTRQLPAYLDVFACGMLAAFAVTWLHARRLHGTRIRLLATGLAAALAILTFRLLQTADAVVYVAGGRERWDLVGRTELGLLLGAFVIASCFALRAWRAAIATPPLVFLSIVSYNVYLWHTLLLIWMWKHGVPRAATPNPHDDEHWKALYIASGWSLVLAVSTAITYFVERPLLSTIKPHTFAFDWNRLRRATPAPGEVVAASLSARRERSNATPGTRT